MAFKHADRVKEATTTTGTGTVTLAGASLDHRTFASALSVGDSCVYCIQDLTAHDWEVGVGTLATSTTLSRDTVLASSNSGSLVSFASGTKDVFITLSGQKLLLGEGSGGAVAPAGTLELFQRSIAGRRLPAIVGPSGVDTTLQPFFGRNKVVTWSPAGNSTTITADGAAALTATGTATAANVATTNRHTYMKRLEYLVTTASTSAVAGFRSGVAQFSVGGAAAGDGGFHYVCRWGPATGVSTSTNRAFVGMASSTAAPTDVQPSSITNLAGMGWDAADTNIQFMYRAAGAINKVDLGSSFPVPTADRTKAYELAMFSKPGTTQELQYLVTDLATGDVASGTLTSNLPATSTLLAPRGWMSVGGTSSVIGIALMGLYIETDY